MTGFADGRGKLVDIEPRGYAREARAIGQPDGETPTPDGVTPDRVRHAWRSPLILLHACQATGGASIRCRWARHG